MHKFPIPIAHDMSGHRPAPKLMRMTFIVLLGLALAPPVEEGGSLCVGQWCEVMGQNTEVRTPILDSAQEGLQFAHRALWSWMSPQFQRLPWNPSYVLPIAAVVMALGMMMLRL